MARSRGKPSKRRDRSLDRAHRIAATLLWVLFLAWTFSLGCFLNRDMDIWWHLRAGREIVETGRVPRVDTYTFSAEGSPWIDLHWLFEVAVYGLYRTGGSELLTLAAAGCATVAVAVATLGSGLSGRLGLSLVLWSPAVLLMSGRFYVRPEVVTLVLLAVYLSAASRFHRWPGLIWLLVPLQVAWVNCQGLFVLGYVVVGCYVAELVLRAVVGRGRWPPRHFWIGLSFLVLAALANPYGLDGALFPWVLMRKLGAEHAFYGEHIAELLSIPRFVERNGFRNPYLLLHLFLLAAGTLSFGAAFWRRRCPLALLLLWVGFSWLGLRATRNSGLFAMVAGWIMVANAAAWLEGWPRRGRRGLRGHAIGAAVLAVAMVAVLSGTWYRFAGEGRLVGLGEHPFWHAHGAARAAADPAVGPYVFAYHEGQAALVEFYMSEPKRVWCDPRLEVVPRAALEEYYELVDLLRTGGGSWRARMARLPGPLVVLLDHEAAAEAEATLLAAPEWTCIYYGDVAGVYAQAPQRGVNFAARYFALDRQVPPARWEEGERKRAEWGVRLGRALLERPAASRWLIQAVLLSAYTHAQRYRALEPTSAAGDRVAGMAALHLWFAFGSRTAEGDRIHDVEQAVELVTARRHLERALRRAPTDFVTLTYLFQVLRALGDRQAALRVAARLRQYSPRTEQQRLLLPAILKQADALEGATESFDAVAAPESLEALARTVQELARQGRWDEALELVERRVGPDALRVDRPALPWELAELWGRLYYLRGNLGRARRVWLAHAPVAPAAELAARIAYSWLAEDAYSAAVERFEEALDADAQQRAAFVGLLKAYVMARALERARGVLDRLGPAQRDELPAGLAELVSRALREQ